MLFALWLKSSEKMRLGLALLAVLPFLLLIMPKSYFERVESISNYEQDQSAMGRIRAWRVATQIALQRPIGGGFNSIIEENYRRYAPEVAEEVDELSPDHFSEAHSIYFKALGDHGFPGLFLYLVLGFSAYHGAGRLARQCRDSPSLDWAGRLAAMIQVSFVGFAVGGAFLGLAYFDLYYCLIAIVLGLQISVRSARQTASEPDSGVDETDLAMSRDAGSR
jgi:probable O-glycosylation ligase (exosortase A-associated)